MIALANIAILIVALMHVYFLILEMFLWDKPYGLRTFGMTPQAAAISKTLAANQGLYNGFLASGLACGLWMQAGGFPVKIIFLVGIIVLGMFGGCTVSRKIFWFQALPGIIAIALLMSPE